jgi:hypothetical protein
MEGSENKINDFDEEDAILKIQAVHLQKCNNCSHHILLLNNPQSNQLLDLEK